MLAYRMTINVGVCLKSPNDRYPVVIIHFSINSLNPGLTNILGVHHLFRPLAVQKFGIFGRQISRMTKYEEIREILKINPY